MLISIINSFISKLKACIKEVGSRLYDVECSPACVAHSGTGQWYLELTHLFSVIAWSQGSYSSPPASSVIVSPAFSWEMF